MLDTPTVANQGDFKQRYCSGYGLVLNDNKKTLVYLRDIRGGVLNFEDGDGFKYNAVLDSGVQFEFIPAMKGWYECEGQAAFITRVPAKQYSRAISNNNTLLQLYVKYDGESRGVLDSVALSVNRMEDIFSYIHDINNAVKRYIDKKTTHAVLSKHFAICGNDVFFYNEIIGRASVVKNKVHIAFTNPICKQEITDLIRRKDCTLVEFM